MKLMPWIAAARPKTLPAAVSPVLIGTALAAYDGAAHLPAAAAAAVCALLLQIGANYANDYFDFIKGSDAAERLGPTRAVAAGWVSPEAMKRAFVLIFLAAAVVGLSLLLRAGWPVLIIGLFAVASAVLYTGGPFPLGYHGLGELFVFIFFGPVAVAGTFYVQALRLTPAAVAAGVPPGLLSVAILTVNNLRDLHDDRRSGKHTLPARLGSSFGRAEYLACLIISLLLWPALLAAFRFVPPSVMIAAAALPLAVPPTRIIFEPPSRRYNTALAQTGRLLFVFSLLFSMGLLL